jgi:Lipocalin-like domain
MKKLIILIAFALISGMYFISCSSDDDSSPTSTIVGKWNYSTMSTTVNGVTSPEIDWDGNEPGCPKDYVEFKSGGALSEGDYFGSSCELNTFVGTWSQNGSTITITEGPISLSAEIVSVTSSMLKFKATETNNGVTIIVNITLTKA